MSRLTGQWFLRPLEFDEMSAVDLSASRDMGYKAAPATGSVRC